MSILIKGMEIPKDGAMIFAIRQDGMVEDVMGCFIGKAVPVPPHGRLGDLDELKVKIKKEDNAYGFDSYGDGMYDAFQSVYQCMDAAPTIIPASEEDDK